MAAKPTPSRPKVPDNADDKEQSERFIDAARDRAKEDGPSLDDVFKKIVRRKRDGRRS